MAFFDGLGDVLGGVADGAGRGVAIAQSIREQQARRRQEAEAAASAMRNFNERVRAAMAQEGLAGERNETYRTQVEGNLALGEGGLDLERAQFEAQGNPEFFPNVLEGRRVGAAEKTADANMLRAQTSQRALSFEQWLAQNPQGQVPLDAEFWEGALASIEPGKRALAHRLLQAGEYDQAMKLVSPVLNMNTLFSDIVNPQSQLPRYADFMRELPGIQHRTRMDTERSDWRAHLETQERQLSEAVGRRRAMSPPAGQSTPFLQAPGSTAPSPSPGRDLLQIGPAPQAQPFQMGLKALGQKKPPKKKQQR